jgi:hypothetical protein
MSHAKKAAKAAALASNIWKDAQREEHCTKLFEAVSAGLQSVTLQDGTQDALCVYEAIAIQMGQLLAGIEKNEADGIMGFVILRAEAYREEFREAGKGAKHFVEDLN